MMDKILTISFLTAFLSAAVRLAMPLMYGGLGELYAEKSGISGYVNAAFLHIVRQIR